jgi:asparagine synthase (glutamine-hydrolysing)
MCGIVGIFDTRGRRDTDRELLHRMNEAQHHRGPDEGGLHVEPGVGLGHRRLSIIDLSTGQQPLYNEDRSVVIVFNGEVYNFQDLFRELSAAGHTFRTRSDTEAIVHAWEAWGEDCVLRLRGMFAFAIWDRNRDTLFLARDRLGKKPLHYALLPDGHLIFGSELKALLVHPGLSREVEPRAVEDYFAYGYVPDPKTILKHAHKLPPGHTLKVRRGEPLPAPREYWDVPFRPVSVRDEAEARESLIERLREATRIRLMSEVPLGAFLSGGVDSSAVVAMMAGLSAEPVDTCSIAFGDPAFNEAQYAAAVAERYHTRHHVDRVDTDDFDLLDTLAALYDEPYADSSAIPTYRVCQLARRHVTVALSGDGGDENFAGYRRYRWHAREERLRRMVPGLARRALVPPLARAYAATGWLPRGVQVRATAESLARETVAGYADIVSVVGADLRSALFSPGFRAELGGYSALEVMTGFARRAPTDHPVSLVQYLDFKTYLPGDILTKVDRASMAHALEVRVPLLDQELVEWVSGLPADWKLRGGEGKHVFKRALEPYLPADVLYRPKQGFAVPLGRWFRGPLRERVRQVLLGPALADTGLFAPAALARVADEHDRGARDHSAAIWSLLMFEAFQRQVLGASPARTEPLARAVNA